MNRNLVPAHAGQFESHARQANAAGLSHGGEFEVEVTVGVTAEEGQTVMAHGCPSSMKLLRTLRAGDGQPVPVSKDYETRYPDGLPLVAGPVLMRARMTVVPNGVLSLRDPRDVLIVPIPAELADDEYPHARKGGDQMVVQAYRCSNLDELFQRHGQAVLV